MAYKQAYVASEYHSNLRNATLALRLVVVDHKQQNSPQVSHMRDGRQSLQYLCPFSRFVPGSCPQTQQRKSASGRGGGDCSVVPPAVLISISRTWPKPHCPR